MAEHSAIEWTDATFNPWIGCTKVGPGCDHCYAEALMDKRWSKVQWGSGQQRVRTSESNWRQPLMWERQHKVFAQMNGGRRRRVFCASLADVFDNEAPPAWRAELFALIDQTPNLDWLLLTKRIGNVAKMIGAPGMQKCGLPPNVWLGATVVTQEEADRDVPKLLAVPARVRFLSVEPMLGPITVPGFNAITSWCPQCKAVVPDSMSHPHEATHGPVNWRLPFDPTKNCISVYDMLHWVIAGGESGPHARPMHPDWARSLRDQCKASGVPFLFKQWGEWLPADGPRVGGAFGDAPRGERQSWVWLDRDGAVHQRSESADRQRSVYGNYLMARVGKKAAGRLLDGRTHDEFPLTKLQAAEKEAREPSLFPPT